jgi:hypothetical protein
MKHIITTSLKQVLADRALALMCLGLLVVGIIYVAYVAFSLNPSDLQLATRYTSYGETHFYRNKWYYLTSFIVFGILFVIVHVGMIIKLYLNELRQLAFAFAWMSIIIAILAFVYTYSVLGIAYLS